MKYLIKFMFLKICLLTVSFEIICVSSTFFEPVAYRQDGDVIIGGLFPLHYATDSMSKNYSTEPTEPKCTRYNNLGFRWMQAMLFAIEHINNRTDLLPHTKLGWELYDTCNNNDRTVVQSLKTVMPGLDNKSPIAVLGAATSDRTQIALNILSVFHKPLISYSATSSRLNDDATFGSFLRTVPNDDAQATAIIELLRDLDWKWVGAIATDDDYGRPGLNKLRHKASEHGICIEFVRYISQATSDGEMVRIADEMKEFNATVFVAFTDASTPFMNLIRTMKKRNVTDKVFIATEAWSTSSSIRKIDADMLAGTLGITLRGGPLPQFADFVQRISPSSQPNNPFLRKFWELYFNCTCPESVCNADGEDESIVTKRVCTGKERIDFKNETHKNHPFLWHQNEYGETDLQKSHAIYVAVQAVAEAIQDILDCNLTSSVLEGKPCPNKTDIQPWQLLAYVRKVTFQPPGENLQKFEFNQQGDPNVSYKLVSWLQKDKPSTEEFFTTVGHYYSGNGTYWNISKNDIHIPKQLTTASIENMETITAGTTSHIPRMICSRSCLPGHRKIPYESSCCYGCEKCPENEIANRTDMEVCEKCPSDLRSDENHTACITKKEIHLKWNDAFGISFVILSTFGLILTMCTSAVFVKYKTTPIIKATNYQLSQLMFISIGLCFVSPLFYVARPSVVFCQLRTYLFTLSYTLAISAVLVKTLRVLSAFEAKLPVAYSKRSRWFGMYVQFGVVGFFLAVQVIICVIWGTLSPPTMREIPDRQDIYNQTLIITCDNGHGIMQGCAYGYVCLLALVAFFLAFRARKLPEDFNEAKFITFAVLFFLLVWGLFIPGYYTTKETSLSPVVYCIAIYVSSYGFLGCLFAPKLYITFFTPHHNDLDRRRQATFSHAVRASRTVVGNTPEIYSEPNLRKLSSWNVNNCNNNKKILGVAKRSSAYRNKSSNSTSSRISTDTTIAEKSDAESHKEVPHPIMEGDIDVDLSAQIGDPSREENKKQTLNCESSAPVSTDDVLPRKDTVTGKQED